MVHLGLRPGRWIGLICKESVMVKGKVFSGRGEGSFFMSIYAKEFRRTLGFIPYPGTLNLKVLNEDYIQVYSSCLKKARPIVVEPPEIPNTKLGRVYVYPANISGLDVFIVRPAISVYKMDVIEVIAEERLRETLNLEDGYEVLVEICCRY